MNFIKFCLFCVIFPFLGHSQDYHGVTAAFYNLENLFDTEDDPQTFDEEYTPHGKKKWTVAKLNDKLDRLASVISQIGQEYTKRPPVIIGLAEVENRGVLEKLIARQSLEEVDYGIIHTDSPDRRGIDIALLYDRNLFVKTAVNKHRLYLKGVDLQPIYTRDQLCVSGYLTGEMIHIIVNHWPSRRGGTKASEPRRMAAAKLTRGIIDSLQVAYELPKIIIMGDFNDNPTNKSFKKVLNTISARNLKDKFGLYNPMEKIFSSGLGSLAYRDEWSLFDQIVVSTPWIATQNPNSWHFKSAHIFNASFLRTLEGKYKGYPKRSFSASVYQSGYSDHFPVYALLFKKIAE